MYLQSLVIVIGYRLSTFDNAGLTTNPTLLQAKYIAWTQTELDYSIIAATIPILRPFVKTLATNYGASVADGFGSELGSSYINDPSSHVASNTYEMHTWRPKGKADYKYRVWTNNKAVDVVDKIGPAGKRDAVCREDASSVRSNNSRRMIIQQDIEWEVK